MRRFLSKLWPFKPEAKPLPVYREEPRVVVPVVAAPTGMRIRDGVVESSGLPGRITAFKAPPAVPGVLPKEAKIAMDHAMDSAYNYANEAVFSEGLSFMGYPYLAELTQRPEYRRPSEILAKEMTRKWIRLQSTGDDDSKADKLRAIEGEMKRLRVQDCFRQAAEIDGFFGRAQIYIDTGASDRPEELAMKLSVSARKIGKGMLKGLTVIEPIWTYPDTYNSTNPLRDDFFKPTSWYVMSKRIHASRMLTFVSRDVPDLLKPAYSFGGLSLSQIAKPYVDNWLRTRQSVSDALHSFSVMVLSTDLSSVLNAGGAETMALRAQLFNQTRDNKGLMMVNKESEELTNVTMPLSGLDKLQAQAQEHQSAVTGIPLVVLLGITPSGLNASSEGELQSFYAWIEAQQETLFGPPLKKLLSIIQLSLFGEIDPEITFAFEPLRVMSEKELADVRKTEADTDVALIGAGVLDPHEARVRLAGQEDSPYASLDLTVDPEPPQAEGPPGGDPFGGGDPGAGGPPGAGPAPGEPGAEPGQAPGAPGAPPQDQQRLAGDADQQRADNGQFGAVSVTTKTKVREPGEGTHTRVELSNGATHRLQKLNSRESMGVPGWHDIDHDQHSYRGDTEEQAISAVIERHEKKRLAHDAWVEADHSRSSNGEFGTGGVQGGGSAPAVATKPAAAASAQAAGAQSFIAPELYTEAKRAIALYSKEQHVEPLTAEEATKATKELAGHLAAAHAAKPGYDAKMKAIGEKLGAKVKLANIKGGERLLEKHLRENASNPAEMKDLVRGSIIVDGLDDVPAALAAIEANFKVARTKDRFAKPNDTGYRDMLISVELPGGILGEVQIHIPEMLAAKSDIGHGLYEIERRLPDGNALKAQLVELQTRVYGSAHESNVQRSKRLRPVLSQDANSVPVSASPSDPAFVAFGYGLDSSEPFANARHDASGSTTTGMPSTSRNREDAGTSESFITHSSDAILAHALALDEEHWITTEGGSHLLITGGGVVIGGAGGNMNGQTLSPKTKSKGRSESIEHSMRNLPEASEGRRLRASAEQMKDLPEVAARYNAMAEASEEAHAKNVRRAQQGPGDDKSKAVASALQNRNRNSAASIAQMNRIASKPNPRLLMAAPTMNDGAPVVSDLAGSGIAKLTGKRDWIVTGKREIAIRYAVVEAGQLSVSNRADGTKNADYAQQADKLTAINNGRTAGVIAAYERGTADEYKTAIAKAEKVHGIPAKAIRAMKNPVLVRIMDAANVDEHIGDESNSTQTLNLSAVEQAANDSTRFDPSGIDYKDDGTPSDESVKGFINAMPESERQSLSPNGRPTKQAIDRMMAATFHVAYGDSELVALMAQATDPESRNLINGMSKAAGSMAKLKDAGDLDIRELVTGAARQIINAVRSGVSIKKFLTQGDLLTGSAESQIAALFAENARSSRVIGEKLSAAADYAYAESQRGGTDMFGETIPTANRKDVLESLHA